MATSNGGSKARLAVLLLLLAAACVFGWYKMRGGGLGGIGGGGSGVEATVANGDLLGKKLEEASAALGASPVEQTNPDGEKSTAKIYLYTLAEAKPDRQFVRVRVASNGNIIATNFVDSSGIVINLERAR